MTWEKSDRRSPRRRWRSRRRPFKSRNRRTVPMTTCRATQGMPASSDAAAAAALLQIVQYLRPQLPPTPSCPSSWIEGGRWTLTCDASKPASACSSLPSYAIIPPPPSPPRLQCLLGVHKHVLLHPLGGSRNVRNPEAFLPSLALAGDRSRPGRRRQVGRPLITDISVTAGGWGGGAQGRAGRKGEP